MHENRTSYPERKTQMYQQLQDLPKKYKVVAIIKTTKVRSTQLLPLRKALKGDVEFVSIKDKGSRDIRCARYQRHCSRTCWSMYVHVYQHVTIQA